MKLEFVQIKKCKLCGIECKNVTSLGAHIQYNHKGYNTKTYYNEFYKQDESEINVKYVVKKQVS